MNDLENARNISLDVFVKLTNKWIGNPSQALALLIVRTFRFFLRLGKSKNFFCCSFLSFEFKIKKNALYKNSLVKMNEKR